MTRCLGGAHQRDVHVEGEGRGREDEAEKYRKGDGERKSLRSEGSGLWCLCEPASPNSIGETEGWRPRQEPTLPYKSQGHWVTEFPLVPRAQCSLLFRPSTDVQSLPTAQSTALIHKYLHRNAHSCTTAQPSRQKSTTT